MMLRCGEVVLIQMQFHQAAGNKVRPALVLLDTGDDEFVAAPITSHSRVSEYDFGLKDWRTAGLNVASWVRIHKLTILAKVEVMRTLGFLSEQDRRFLLKLLCHAFCPNAEQD
jgi:mRNA interferase MazF